MSSRIPNILRAVYATPWAIQPEKLRAIVEYLELRASGIEFTKEELQARAGPSPTRVRGSAPASVAVIPVTGVISQREVAGISTGGGTPTERVAAMLDEALASADIQGIIL